MRRNGLPAVFVLLTPLLWGAEDVDAVLKRLIEAEPQNEKRAQQYTYTEETERFVFDKDGRARRTAAETHEIIFVEGLKYKKLIARNSKPLRAREQAQVEKDMRLTAAERRRNQRPLAPGGMVTFGSLFTHQSLDLGSLAELPALFDNRLVGEEEVRGHKAWVIECLRRNGYVPRSEHERQVLEFRKKFWVDQADGCLVRAIYTVDGEDSPFGKGSSLTFESEKVDGSTWELESLTLDFSRTKQAVFKPAYRTIYRMSKFQKFDVQSTITVVEPER